MFKLIGSVLILIATTWAGYGFASQLSDRSRQLQLLRNSLETLNAEIMYGHTPLGEAAMKISKQFQEPIAQLYKTFAENLKKAEITVGDAWKESLASVWPETALKSSEFEILEQFGGNLGRHDRETQQKHIILTLTHLKRQEDEAHSKQSQYEKVMKSAGVLVGLLIILLLI